MIEEKRIRELAEERLATFDGYIVELTIGSGNNIKILIDADHSVSINECMSVSRNVEHNLDREVEDFSLEVSTAGLDQPFKHLRQYLKNVNREVSLADLEDHKFEGLLSSADENGFTVLSKSKERIEGRKAKQWVEVLHSFKYSEINKLK